MRDFPASHLTAIRDEPAKLVLNQRACGMSAAAQALLLVTILTAVMVPGVMVAASAVAEASVRDRLVELPVNAAGALIGVTVWLAMFGIPAFRALRRLGWSRIIEIDPKSAKVHDRTIFGRRTFTLPLTAFDGVSHHVRTNLSGTRHELVLVHPERAKSLVVKLGESISQAETEAFACRFNVNQLPAGSLFRRGFRLPRLGVPPLFKPQHA